MRRDGRTKVLQFFQKALEYILRQKLYMFTSIQHTADRMEDAEYFRQGKRDARNHKRCTVYVVLSS